MTELTENEKAEIRKWAWEKAGTLYFPGSDKSPRFLKINEVYSYADQIAAWVMSGKLPEVQS